VDAALLAGNRDVLAQDEREASAGARSKPVTLLHRWKGRSAALTARIHVSESLGASGGALGALQ
jgi:hypothetical protein